MDGIKLLAKNKKKLETLVQTIRIYSQDAKMEFGIQKCALLIMIERKEMPNLESIRTCGEKENYKYLGILEADTIKQMKEKK